MEIASKFSSMTKDELIDYCRKLYGKYGLEALTYPFLKKEKALYHNLYRKGVTQKVLVGILNLSEDFKKFKRENFVRYSGEKIQRGWTWERILGEARSVVKELNFLPPAAWFQNNGYGSLIQAVYNRGKTWEDLRMELDSFHGSSFVESRNGIRWRSHPEASLSNFLYARGIKHKRGRKYPKTFSDSSGQSYGYFDLYFLDRYKGWIDVEIWGEKPHGHNQEIYAKRRASKEKFNAKNPNFLGIEFRDCYNEDRLTVILEPYIGIIKPFIFDKPLDKEIHSTHWSNADELLEFCRELALQQPDGKLPTEDWLRRRGKWKGRPGPAYNTLAVYIKLWIGGIRKVRDILGQPENSTTQWNRESALTAYQEWYKVYGRSPSSVRMMHQMGQLTMTASEFKRAANIAHAVRVYVGNTEEVHRVLDLPAPRKSPTKRIRQV